MAVSKVVFNGDTLMDVTNDSVTSETLLENETATRNDGVRVTGSLTLTETDPVFTASAAYGISTTDISNWNDKVDAAGASAAAPVQSVNGSTGAVTVSVPSASNATPQALGTAAAGSSGDFSRADHVHAKPTYSASDVGLGNVENVLQYSASNPPPYPVDSVNGQTGTVTLSIPTKTSDLVNDSNYMSGMTILSYGHSTWAEALAAYNSKHVVYCRASSNSNPANGAQTRMAFLAYINADPPTNMEFQYYRSVNSHSATQQGDQMYVYKIESNGTWSVTIRESYTKIVAGTGLSSSYNNGTLTLSNSQTGLPSVTSSDNGKVLRVINGAWAAASLPNANGVGF